MADKPLNESAILGAMEEITRLIDMAASYRMQAEAAGFSPRIAEEMAFGFHGALLMAFFSGKSDE